MREVARTLLPSTRAEMTAARRSSESLFILPSVVLPPIIKAPRKPGPVWAVPSCRYAEGDGPFAFLAPDADGSGDASGPSALLFIMRLIYKISLSLSRAIYEIIFL